MKSRRILSLILISLFLVVSISLPALATAKSGEKPKHNQSVAIYRDSYGVPHIYAKDTYGLFYGYGYSVATDRLFEMEMIKRTVLGTVAEVLGPGPTSQKLYLANDITSRSGYSPSSIKAQYDALDEKYKEIFEGYAAGMNARIAEVLANQSTLLPKQYTEYGFLPSAWTPFDVIMVFVGTVCNRYSDFTSALSNMDLLNYLKSYKPGDAWDIFNQVQWVNDHGAPTTIPLGTQTASKEKHRLTTHRRPDKNLGEQPNPILALQPKEISQSMDTGISTERPSASNVWLLGKKKTADGGSIFINGPQFGWFNPGYVYEVGLHGAGFDLVGNTPFGYPAIFFGHNRHITCGSTAGGGTLVDIFEEYLKDASLDCENPYKYIYNGECRDMEKRTEVINVKGGSPVSVDIYRTVHGFVVRFDVANGKAYSKKRSWEGHEIESLIGWIESIKAENYNQWLEGASKMAISINWFYADQRGNIGYMHNGKYPIRHVGHDFRIPASGKGDMEWLGIFPFDQNPQMLNPDQGYIVNWNNKPREDWIGSSWGSADRVDVIIDELEVKDKFTRQDAWDINKRISFIDVNIAYFLPFLKEAVEGLPSTDLRKMAVDHMVAWDRYRKDADNNEKYDDPGQTIFQKWLAVMIEKVLKDDLGAQFPRFASAGYPTTPPSGSTNVQQGTRILYHVLLGDESTIPNIYDFLNDLPRKNVVLSALDDTISALKDQFGGTYMADWLLPVVKQQFFYTNFAGIPQASVGEHLYLPIQMNRGTENHLVVFRHGNVEGWDVCPPGQSGFVAPDGTPSPHYQDQMNLYKNFDLKPMLFDLNEVMGDSGPAQVLYY
jgi:penicillin amidase